MASGSPRLAIRFTPLTMAIAAWLAGASRPGAEPAQTVTILADVSQPSGGVNQGTGR